MGEIMNMPQWLQWFCVIALCLLSAILVVVCLKRRRGDLSDIKNLTVESVAFEKGGFALVYKGVLDGNQVAVKCMKMNFTSHKEKREVIEMFRNEARILRKLQHRHIVKFIGYRDEEVLSALVMKFVPNKTLKYHLHGEHVMSWENRLKVAVGVASALSYLHHDCLPRIIHRDIKSSNVLLDDDFEAQVADFGLATDENDTSQDSSKGKGTPGYIAPEYTDIGRLSDKCDVYSYGILLLEIVSGHGAEDVLHWAQQHLARALHDRYYSDLVDQKLKESYNKDEIHVMIMVANACTSTTPETRPQMSTVLHLLDKKRTANISLDVQQRHDRYVASEDAKKTSIELTHMQ
ncbi:hypothetical protein ACHQM5_014527 [Ranunculus cassubicifolius]